jgi:hypothetical protein
LSRLINQFSALERDNLWAPALQNLALTIENLRLSGFDSNECRAIES